MPQEKQRVTCFSHTGLCYLLATILGCLAAAGSVRPNCFGFCGRRRFFPRGSFVAWLPAGAGRQFFPELRFDLHQDISVRERRNKNIGSFRMMERFHRRAENPRIARSRTRVTDDGSIFAARKIVGIRCSILKEEIHQEDAP